MKKRKIKAITSFTLIGSILFGGNINSTQAERNFKKIVPDQMVPAFLDVPSNHWANSAITNLVKQGIMVGYGNDGFGLGDSVTREQVAVVIYRIKFPEKVVEAEAHNPYRDLNKSSTMFLDEILTLTKMGIFSGDEKGNFRPKSPISRAEMTQVIKNAFNIPVVGKHTFHDVAKDYWANDAISALQSNQLVSGTGNGLFEPYKSVTREEYAQFIFNVLKYEDLVNKEKQLDELNKKRDVLNRKIDEFDKLNSQRQDLESMLEELNQKLSQLKQQSPQLQELENKLKESQNRLLELNKKDSNRLELNREIEKINDRKAELSNQIMQLIEQKSEFDKKIKNEKDDLNQKKNNLVNKLNEINNQKLQREDVENKLNELNKKREYLINQVAESKKFAKKKAELNTKLVELFKAQEAFNKKRDSYYSELNKLNTADAARQRINNELNHLENELKQFENELVQHPKDGHIDEKRKKLNTKLVELFKTQEAFNKKRDLYYSELNKLNNVDAELQKINNELKVLYVEGKNLYAQQFEKTDPEYKTFKVELIENLAKTKKLHYQLEQLSNIDTERQRINSDLRKLDVEFRDLNNEMIGPKSQLIKLDKQNSQRKELEEKLTNANKKREDFLKKLSKLNEVNTGAERQKISDSLMQLDGEFKNLDNKMSGLKNQLAEFNKQLEKYEQIEKELEEYDKKLDNTKKQLAEFDKSNIKRQELENELVQLTKKTDELGKPHKHRQELSASINKAFDEAKEINKKLAKKDPARQEINDKLKKLDNDWRLTSNKLDRLNSELHKVNTELLGYSKEHQYYNAVNKKRTELSNKVDEIYQKQSEIDKNYIELNRQLDKLSNPNPNEQIQLLQNEINELNSSINQILNHRKNEINNITQRKDYIIDQLNQFPKLDLEYQTVKNELNVIDQEIGKLVQSKAE
ncbi:TPA: S-layer homology domain-containing protein [Bacillus cereus]